jgi:hypothetical protein
VVPRGRTTHRRCVSSARRLGVLTAAREGRQAPVVEHDVEGGGHRGPAAPSRNAGPYLLEPGRQLDAGEFTDIAPQRAH